MGTTDNKIYFAYGSNLWLDQMARRCPSSAYIGLGRLRNYKWFINARGYANVARSPTFLDEPPSEADEVWGLVYRLTPEDEKMLDLNEGVPYAYEKRVIAVEFWGKGAGHGTADDVGRTKGKEGKEGKEEKGKGEEVEMLVYIDFKRDQGGYKPREEYIVRMNRGIEDALREGVPGGYVREVLRGYIPEEGEGEKAEEVKRLAERQAGGLGMRVRLFRRGGGRLRLRRWVRGLICVLKLGVVEGILVTCLMLPGACATA
ncbi:hypothetical protein B0T21DRAFT_347767 [Apiosordaria backusii]|uniref:gamma-glutamylcyclotransferase n=1 Tax=Apiosordaria backusii TaxID=314023 RepID=A0AA40BNH1_9PEZI|nr:hypothetical protein B0T21DRAFT_347767 [Apiosordaria backusii]